jgi:hypothetical protein
MRRVLITAERNLRDRILAQAPRLSARMSRITWAGRASGTHHNVLRSHVALDRERRASVD